MACQAAILHSTKFPDKGNYISTGIVGAYCPSGGFDKYGVYLSFWHMANDEKCSNGIDDDFVFGIVLLFLYF